MSEAADAIGTGWFNTLTNVAVKQLPDSSKCHHANLHSRTDCRHSAAPLKSWFGSVESRRICRHMSVRRTLRRLLWVCHFDGTAAGDIKVALRLYFYLSNEKHWYNKDCLLFFCPWACVKGDDYSRFTIIVPNFLVQIKSDVCFNFFKLFLTKLCL